MKLSGFLCLLTMLSGPAFAQDDVQIEAGKYLAIVADCAACHTYPGAKPFAGGRPIETPFGTLIAPNLTPDRDTGIGAMSDDDFVNALQLGRGANGRHLYPAMPYPHYTKIPRNDILAIRAYLRTLEPVSNKVVANQLPFPFNIRLIMAAWNLAFFEPGQVAQVAGKSMQWNRGAYLVEGPGHCGDCHTAKNFLGADETSRELQGGKLQGWFAQNLTGDPHQGLGTWSADDIVAYLKTGHNRITAATGPMAEVVTDSTSQMNDIDLQAIAVYLKDQPAAPGTSPQPAAADAMRNGQALYADNCAACHGAEGSGVEHLFPAFKASPAVQASDPANLIRFVLQGAQSVATGREPTGAAMPAFNWKLSDPQVAELVTYIRNQWGNASPAVAAGDVAKERDRLAKNPR